MRKLTFYTLLLALISFVGCNKIPDPTNPNPSSFNAPNPAPTFSNADGLLAAITTLTNQSTAVGDFVVEADVATAAFFNTSTTFYDAGTVSVNTNDLEIQNNNSYVSVSQNSANIDLGFGSTAKNKWAVGGSANVASFNHTTGRAMPSDVAFVSETEEVNTANAYTVNIKAAPNTTDSILYLMAAEGKTITKTVSNTTISVTFSAADMSGLDGTGVIQVVPYNFEFAEYGGKNMYFVNEKVITDMVTFK